MDEADEPWEIFYWSRLSFAHVNELMLALERSRAEEAIADFVAQLDQESRERYERIFALYDADRRALNRLRNEVIFHYPYDAGERALGDAITAARDDDGEISSGPGHPLDIRFRFADDLLARMVFNAAGGGQDAYTALVERLAILIPEIAAFVDAALDLLFQQRVGSAVTAIS